MHTFFREHEQFLETDVKFNLAPRRTISSTCGDNLIYPKYICTSAMLSWSLDTQTSLDTQINLYCQSESPSSSLSKLFLPSPCPPMNTIRP